MKNNMKKIVSILLITILSFSFASCNSSAGTIENMSPVEIVKTYGEKSKEAKSLVKKNSKLDKEKVLKNVEETVKLIKSTSTSYDINVDKLDEKGEKVSGSTIKYAVNVKSIYNDENGELQEIYNQVKIAGDEKITGSYVNLPKNKTFINDGTGLKEITLKKDEGPQINNESEYKNTVKMMIMAAKFMNFSEDDNNYYLSFTGKNGDLLYMIDGLFGLGTDVFNLDKVDMDVKYTIRKADFALTEVVHKVNQEYKGIKYKSEGKFKLENVNDFKEIEEVKGLIKEENQKK